MGGIGGCIEKVGTMEVSKESITTDTYVYYLVGDRDDC
jgi:hypothetical protein